MYLQKLGEVALTANHGVINPNDDVVNHKFGRCSRGIRIHVTNTEARLNRQLQQARKRRGHIDASNAQISRWRSLPQMHQLVRRFNRLVRR